MRTMSKIVAGVVVAACCASTFADSVIIFQDDMGTTNSWEVIGSHPTSGVWIGNGSEIEYTTPDNITGTLRTAGSGFDVSAYAAGNVTLEFTSSVFNPNRNYYKGLLEIGLMDIATLDNKYRYANIDESSDLWGFALVHATKTSDDFIGLSYTETTNNLGVDLLAPIPAATYTNWKIVFTSSSTELFMNGASLGSITNTLDFARDYAVTIAARGPGDQNLRKVDNVLLTGSVIPEPATLGMVAMAGGALFFIRRRLMI